MSAYIDPVNKTTYPLTNEIWRSPFGGPLMLTPLEGIQRDKIDQKNRSIWGIERRFR